MDEPQVGYNTPEARRLGTEAYKQKYATDEAFREKKRQQLIKGVRRYHRAMKLKKKLLLELEEINSKYVKKENT